MKRILGLLGAVAFFLLFANAAGAQDAQACLDDTYAASYPGCTAEAGSIDGWNDGIWAGYTDSMAGNAFNPAFPRSAYSEAYGSAFEAGYRYGYSLGCSDGGACQDSGTDSSGAGAGAGAGDGNLTINVNVNHPGGHKDCSEYWSMADCYAGCEGNGFVGGDDCKKLGNGVVTPGGVDGGGKGDGGNSGGGNAGGGNTGGGNKGGGLAVTGSSSAVAGLAGASLLVLGGTAAVVGKRRMENNAG